MTAEAPNDEDRRALAALARLHDGCPEAELLAAGFSVGQLSGLTIDGLTEIELKRFDIDGNEKLVICTRITKAGRRAIAA
jgi:hypothetical protein